MLSNNHKAIIGKILLKCLSTCNDVVAIYNLAKDHTIPTHRNSFPLIPDIEILVITNSSESAETLYKGNRYPEELQASHLLSNKYIVNTIYITKDEFTELNRVRKSMLRLRLLKSTIVYQNNKKDFNNRFIAY